jgi:hypothetical protein
MSERPAVIEKEIHCCTTQDAKDVGHQIVHVKKFSQDPQDGNIRQDGRTGSQMVLKHSLKVFPLPLPAPVVPGPEIIQHEVVQKRYLNRDETGKKIENPHGLGEEPEEEHVDRKSPGTH